MADIQQGTESTATMAPLAGTWTLDPAASTLEFHTKAMWVMKVKGTFKALEGTALVTDGGGVSGTLVVDAASVDTGTKKRDQHLLTADFFDVAKYPTFLYTVTGSRLAPEGKVTLTGTFTAHGQTHPLDLLATVSSAAGGSVSVTAEGDLDRSKWGLTWAKMGAGLHNHLVVTAVFKKA